MLTMAGVYVHIALNEMVGFETTVTSSITYNAEELAKPVDHINPIPFHHLMHRHRHRLSKLADGIPLN